MMYTHVVTALPGTPPDFLHREGWNILYALPLEQVAVFVFETAEPLLSIETAELLDAAPGISYVISNFAGANRTLQMSARK